MPPVRTALISVSDKTGVAEFAAGLVELGVRILSSGGTAAHLRQAGVPVTDVSEYTGFPEMMDGRVKTLHPKVHGGLLALRDNPEHIAAAKRHGMMLIDLVAVNLYPFEQAIAKPGVALAEAIENIDIGGPSMVRSAAKNNRYVAVVTNPARYPELLREMHGADGELSDATRLSLAVEAFNHTARYDGAIHRYLAAKAAEGDQQEATFPTALNMAWTKTMDLRYGENPHQAAAFYVDAEGKARALGAMKQLHGKQLSYNNLLDMDAVYLALREYASPAAIIVKHNSPCGLAEAGTLAEAYTAALECDPLSAFGGVIGLNGRVDGDTAAAIMAGISRYGFMEIVLAPSFSPEALEQLRAKRDLRLVEVPDLCLTDPLQFREVTGGLLTQQLDDPAVEDFQVVTKAQPEAGDMDTVRFAWKSVKHVKSNAILIAQGTRAVGIGGGVTSRVDAVWLAVRKAGERAQGAVLASDAFFPKPDAVQVAANAGVKILVQPGGSLGDAQTIEMCDQLGLVMLFTGRRHFRH